MYTDGKLLIAQGDESVYLYPSMTNRHGIIAGATLTTEGYQKALERAFTAFEKLTA